MEKFEDEILDALDSIVAYNGHGPEIERLINHVETYQGSMYNYNNIIYPDFLPKDCNHFLRIIWSIMVLIWGDYGTSPRFGWIESKNKNEVLKFLKRIKSQDDIDTLNEIELGIDS